MLHFDNRGYLTPYKVIPSTVKEMREYFVENIRSETRKEIFEKYLRYSDDLKDVLGGIPLKQWVNGSFVTMKRSPKDIDLVTFIDHYAVNKIGNKIDNFRSIGSRKTYGVDAYVMEIYPNESSFHRLMKYDLLEWENLFINNRPVDGLYAKKGFLEIIY
jgi:hypothetical protein